MATSAAEMELQNNVSSAAARENFDRWWTEDRAAEINERWRIKRKFLDAKGDDPSLASKYVVIDVLENVGDHKKVPELLKEQMEKRTSSESETNNSCNWVSIKGCNYVSTENVCKALSLPEYSTVDKVVLGDGIEADDAKDVAELIKVNKSITSLDLSNNKLETEGLKVLLDAMTHNSTITSLDISSCSFGTSAGKPLATYLAANPPLQRLLLNGNKLGIHGTDDLTRGLEHNTILTTLGLFMNNIGEDGGNSLLSLLRSTPEEGADLEPKQEETGETTKAATDKGSEVPEQGTPESEGQPEVKDELPSSPQPPSEPTQEGGELKPEETLPPPKPRNCKNKTLLQIELSESKCSNEQILEIETILELNNSDARQREIDAFKQQELSRMQKEEDERLAQEKAATAAAEADTAKQKDAKKSGKTAAKPAAKSAKSGGKTAATKPSGKAAAKPGGKKSSAGSSTLPAINKK